jgi:Tfp pilus assembly protein PilV
MEYYLEQSLRQSDRDTQILFHWPELWTHYHLRRDHLHNAFTDVAADGIALACIGASSGFRFNGWLVSWTGWKRLTNTDVIVCQWIANSGEYGGWQLHSSYPGASGPHMTGFIFDISIKDDQEIPTVSSTQDDLDRMRRACLFTLLKEIQVAGRPPYTPPRYLS